MKARIAVALAVLALVACDEPPPPATARGAGSARGPSGSPPVPVSALPPVPGTAPDRASARDRRAPTPPVLPPAGAGGGAPSTEPSGAPPVEDRLREALQRAFGAPTECVGAETRRRLSGRLTVHVQVNVTSAGRVTRASVSSSRLAASDLECMQRHAEGLRLALEVPDAPRSVSASVEYEVTPEGEITTEREPYPVAPVAGRVTPDSTLPAAGTVRDRPSGTVAPDSTLERAGTATTRPAGSVPPSFTLPAVAE